MERITATGSHAKSYPDPIAVRAGEALHLSGRTDVWEGHTWLWAIAADGREGWVPDNILTSEPSGARARTDYAAVELSCEPGDVFDVIERNHGWVRCRAADGGEGWLPASVFRSGQPA